MSWSNPPTDFVDEYELEHAENVQALAITFWDRVKGRTPRDTGRAQGNWHMSKDVPSDMSWDSTELHEPVKTKLTPYPVYYVQNNLEYIVPLEYGHSKIQAPNGMFRIVLAELK